MDIKGSAIIVFSKWCSAAFDFISTQAWKFVVSLNSQENWLHCHERFGCNPTILFLHLRYITSLSCRNIPLCHYDTPSTLPLYHRDTPFTKLLHSDIPLLHHCDVPSVDHSDVFRYIPVTSSTLSPWLLRHNVLSHPVTTIAFLCFTAIALHLWIFLTFLHCITNTGSFIVDWIAA